MLVRKETLEQLLKENTLLVTNIFDSVTLFYEKEDQVWVVYNRGVYTRTPDLGEAISKFKESLDN